MMRTFPTRAAVLLAAFLATAALAPAAWAAEATDASAGGSQALLKLLLGIVLALLGCVGAGAMTLLLRVILPAVGAAADASLRRLGTGRLFLTGVLPLLGAALLARGAQLTGSPVVGGLCALLVLLPLALALLVGALAALPHVGLQALRTDPAPAPLRAAAVGGLVVGLAMASWVLPPLGVAVSVLLAGWLLGIGLGALVRRPVRVEPPADTASPG